MARRVATERVAWVPVGHAEGLGVEVEAPGEYRVIEGDPGETTITDQRVEWVDDAPEDDTDGSGHFEVAD